MISDELRAIFIHIPKTGGRSVTAELFPVQEPEMLFGSPNPHQTGGLQHLFARHVRQEVGEDRFDRYFSFAFVRNPFSKAVSQYLYTIGRRPDLQRRLGIDADTSFDGYVQALRDVDFDAQLPAAMETALSRASRRRSGKRFVAAVRSRAPGSLHVQWDHQHRFVQDSSGQSIVDFVGRYERLQTDFDEVCDRLDVARRQLPWHSKVKGRSRPAHHSEYYDDSTRNAIADIYARDLEVFGYSFEDAR